MIEHRIDGRNVFFRLNRPVALRDHVRFIVEQIIIVFVVI